MAKDHHKNTINKNQGNMAPPEPSYPNIASPGCPNTAEAQDDDLKSNPIEMIENFKKEMNKSLKELSKNRDICFFSLG